MSVGKAGREGPLGRGSHGEDGQSDLGYPGLQAGRSMASQAFRATGLHGVVGGSPRGVGKRWSRGELGSTRCKQVTSPQGAASAFSVLPLAFSTSATPRPGLL